MHLNKLHQKENHTHKTASIYLQYYSMIANKRLWLDTIINSMSLGTLSKLMHL